MTAFTMAPSQFRVSTGLFVLFLVTAGCRPPSAPEPGSAETGSGAPLAAPSKGRAETAVSPSPATPEGRTETETGPSGALPGTTATPKAGAAGQEPPSDEASPREASGPAYRQPSPHFDRSTTMGKGPPVVAVAAFTGREDAPTWIGLVIAEHATRRLLGAYPATNEREPAVEVFDWRQTMSAARAAGLLPADLDVRGFELLAELGADRLLTGTYAVNGDRVDLRWKMVGSVKPTRELAVKLTDLSRVAYAIGAEALVELGRSPERGAPVPLPLGAARSWGRSLEILARQSQDARATVVLGKDELALAATELSSLTATAPNFMPAWAARARVAVLEGDWEAADAALSKATSLPDGGSPAAALARYYVYEQKTQRDDALAALESAVEAYPGSLQVLGYLGDGYYSSGAFEEALSVFTTYLERVPKSPYAAQRRDAVLARMGRMDEALRRAQALLAKHPRSAPLIAALASRQIDAKKFAEARETLEGGLELRPDHPLLLTRLSYVELEMGDPKRALVLAEKAVEVMGEGRGERAAGYALIDMARALAVLGRRDEAKIVLKKAVRQGVDGNTLFRLTEDPRLKGFIKLPLVLSDDEADPVP